MTVDEIIKAGDVAEARIVAPRIPKREVVSAWIKASAQKVPAVAAVFEREMHARDGLRRFDECRIKD